MYIFGDMSRLHSFVVVAFAVFLVLQSYQLVAQANGYVVLERGDTLRGQLRACDGADCELTIGFQHQDSQRVYTTRDLRAYGFDNGVHFIRIYVEGFAADNAPVAFARVMAEGKAKLLRLHGSTIERVSNASKVGNFRYYLVVDNTISILRANNLARTLEGLTSDCASLTTELRSVKMTQKHLVNFVNKYNQCTGSYVAGVNPEAKTIIRPRTMFFVTAGATSANVDMYYSFEFFPGETTTGFQPRFGLQASKTVGKGLVVASLAWFRYSTEFKTNFQYAVPNLFPTQLISLNETSVATFNLAEFSLDYGYGLQIKRIKLYPFIGFSFQYLVSQEGNQILFRGRPDRTYFTQSVEWPQKFYSNQFLYNVGIRGQYQLSNGRQFFLALQYQQMLSRQINYVKLISQSTITTTKVSFLGNPSFVTAMIGVSINRQRNDK